MLGIKPTDGELDELVIQRDREKGVLADELDELTIKECGGPAEAAKETLSRAAGLSTGTLSEAKRRANLLPQRTEFGQWVTSAVRDGYLRDLIAAEREKAMAVTIASVRSVGDMDEATGRALDSSVERFTREFFTTDIGLLALFSGEPTSPRMREIQDEFHSRWSTRYALILALIYVAPDTAQERLEQIAELGQRVQESARVLISVLRTGDEEAIKRATTDLHVAVCLRLLESVRDHQTSRFRQLDG